MLWTLGLLACCENGALSIPDILNAPGAAYDLGVTNEDSRRKPVFLAGDIPHHRGREVAARCRLRRDCVDRAAELSRWRAPARLLGRVATYTDPRRSDDPPRTAGAARPWFRTSPCTQLLVVRCVGGRVRALVAAWPTCRRDSRLRDVTHPAGDPSHLAGSAEGRTARDLDTGFMARKPECDWLRSEFDTTGCCGGGRTLDLPQERFVVGAVAGFRRAGCHDGRRHSSRVPPQSR